MATTLDSPAWTGRDRFGAAAESRQIVRDRFLLVLFLVGIAGATLFQKIGYVIGNGVLPIVLPMVLGGVVVGCLVLKPVFDPVRIGLFAAAMIAAGLSTVLGSPVYSATSFLLFVMLYLPLLVSFETTDATYRRCMDSFVTIMLCFCGVVMIEHAVQFLLDPQLWPNLNKLVPQQWLIPQYNYLQPIIWGYPWHKPNGIVFLEVSILSQYIALALALEIALFQRPVRLVILTGTLLATFAGTGPLLMALTLPVLLGRLKIRQMLMVIAALGIISLIAFKIGWFDIASERMNEYKHNGSSANMRFIEPLDRLIAFLGQGNPLFSGIGAGQIEKGRNFQWWPFTKASIEYGLIPGLMFYGFFLYTLFRNAPYRTLAFTLAVWYSLEGALLTAINPLMCVLLSTMFSIRRDAPDGALASRAPATSLFGWLSGQPRPASNRSPAAARRAAVRIAAELPARSEPRIRSEPPPAAVPQTGVQAPAAHVVTTPRTDGRLIYAIGDVHGRADLLAPLLAQIAEDAQADPPIDGRKPIIVMLGDYIDRGRRSREVIDQIIALQEGPDFEVRALLGNHEEAMLAYLDGTSSGVSFGRYGGRATLESYGVEAPRESDGPEAWERAREAFRNAVPAAHIAFLRALELVVEIGGCLFVHAGLRAGIPLDRQSRRDILYIRDEFFNAPVDCGRFIVHGHTPGEAAYGAPGRLCLDTGAYASGILTAGRFDGTEPRLLQAGGQS